MQVDSQLFGSCKPVLLYVTPTSPQRETAADTKPALTLAVHRMPSRNWDANIFKVHELHAAFVHIFIGLFFLMPLPLIIFTMTLLHQFCATVGSHVLHS